MTSDRDEFHLPHQALAARAGERGDAEALIFPHQSARLDYESWWARSQAVARGLLEVGVRPGDHVALLAENRIEWPIAQIGIAAAGAVLVPLNTHYRAEDLRHVLELSEARAILLSASFRANHYLDMLSDLRGRLPALEWVVSFDPPGSADPSVMAYPDLLARGHESGARLPEVDASSVGSLQFTSGTTGVPKGAMLSHAGMMMNARGTVERLRLSAGDRWTSIIPLFHCAGCIMSIMSVVQTGAAYVGVPAFSPTGMFEMIERERCTLLTGVPTSFLAMLEAPDRGDFDLSSLRGGTCGGADADPAVLARCVEEYPIPQLVQVYGQTESSTLITCPTVDDPQRFATAGPALPGYELRITDPRTGEHLERGVIGQIEARGPMTMLGYHKRADATAETLNSEGWLRTGDLGYLDPEDRLILAGGRLRDMIIRGGENIYPVEIENLLRAHPGVSEIAVFGMPDRYYGEIVAAAVLPIGQLAAEDLRDFARDRIAGFKIPVDYYRVEDFPMTASGKIRKHQLRALAEAGGLSVLDDR